MAQCPSLEFIIDGTERRINRPKDKTERKQYYSGKKKTFTVKNNIISQRRGKVVFLSDLEIFLVVSELGQEYQVG
ncbi:transposase family protein [Trichocoleus desertorum AS-A10]|uniref:transposase family protein n=1 Tax=Trichocoleus desertorum TaxID=1481672 RepID=UPI00329BF661